MAATYHALVAGFVVSCLALVGLTLTGCAGGGGGNVQTKTTVLVMRHCIRSTAEDGIHDVEGLTYYNNYSHDMWPAFDVPAYYCLARGTRLVEASGRWYKAHGNLPEPVHVIADDCIRDNTTGQALLKGLGLAVDKTSFRLDGSPFNAASDCPLPSNAEVAEAVKAQLKAYPMEEPEFQKLTAKLGSILQEGAAKGWTNTSCYVNSSSAYLDGSCSAASDFTERLLMEWGGALPVGWGRIATSEIPSLLRLHSWYRQVVDAVPSVVAKTEASILKSLSAALKDGQQGTKIFVGHDSQLNALNAALGLTWNASPFPVNATLPGSALRFDRDGDDVRVTYVFLANYSDDSSTMTSVPATGSSSDTMGHVSITKLRAAIDSGMVDACANPVISEEQRMSDIDMLV